MASETNEIRSKIRQFIIDNFPVAQRNHILDSDDLLNNSIVDSLGILNIVNFIEEEFGTTFYDEEFLPQNFQTISYLSNFVKAKQDGN